MPTLRPLLRSAAVLIFSLTALAPWARAQTAADAYPARPVKVVVPFAPGGVVDVMARLLTQKLAERLNSQFYIDNQGGAGGNIGTASAAQAPPDGYTLLINSSSFVVNAKLHAKVNYDPVASFTPITVAAASPNVLTVHPSVPAKTVQELVALIRSGKANASFASAGVATTPHLSGELFRLSLGLDMVHVPFTGSGPALGSVVGGHTPIAFTGLPPAMPFIKNGSVRALAVTSAQRSSAAPDVPTMAEAGVLGQEAETLMFILAPAGTPKEIVGKLSEALKDILAQPDIQGRFDALGFAPLTMKPEQAAARVKEELAKWGRVIQEAKLQQP